jgi:heme exporter protein CcmD
MTHSGFILAAFGITFLVVAGLVVSILLDHRALKRDLARLDPDHQRG